MRKIPKEMAFKKEIATEARDLRNGMLTRSSPASRDDSHHHARAEHYEFADEDEDDRRGGFRKQRQETPPGNEHSSRRLTEGPILLEGWDSPALGREQMSSFTGQPGIKGRNESIRMMLLCFIHFGITFTWYCFPMAIFSIRDDPKYSTRASTLPPFQAWPHADRAVFGSDDGHNLGEGEAR